MIRRKRLPLLACLFITAVAALWPDDVSAQRRTVVRRAPIRRVVILRPGYSFARPYFGFGYGFGYGHYGPIFRDHYQYRPYPPYRRYNYEPGSDLRIQVDPRDAEVYVDGYLVGTVDEFDGMFQRLRVPYGEHDIEIYRDGYRPVRQRMLFRPGETYRIKQGMEPVPAGEQTEPRPVPPERPREQRPDPRGRVPAGRPDEQAAARNEDFGTLAIRVVPSDAVVTIDGERWDRPEGEARLLIELSEGAHHIEVRKEGFKPYVSTVRVRRGETVTVNVSLPQGEG